MTNTRMATWTIIRIFHLKTDYIYIFPKHIKYIELMLLIIEAFNFLKVFSWQKKTFRITASK